MRTPTAAESPARPAGALQWAQLFRVVHLLPGRMRLRFKALKGRPSIAAELRQHLGAVPGISHVDVNPLTGSLLLHYDPHAITTPAFLDALSGPLEELLPGLDVRRLLTRAGLR